MHGRLSTTGAAQVRAAQAARTSYGRLLALLAAGNGDIAAAEDALGDAFERALTAWPADGVPHNPDAWLLTVARNRMRDRWKSPGTRMAVEWDPERHGPAHLDELDLDAVPDRRLELMLVCAHPAIDKAVRTPLMLNTVLGCTGEQIARAFALPAPTLAARLVRAKRRIKDARIPFQIPDVHALGERMDAVLEAVYGAYAIDWHTTGTELRPALVGEALHLAETLAHLAPGDAEAHGLAGLICLSQARGPARLDAEGAFVPLREQDPARWDGELIRRGREHLRRAHGLRQLGRFQLEAAIQAVHCARRESGTTDWGALRDLYDALHGLAPSLGSATALAAVAAETDGPEAGLALLDELVDRTARFQPAWATRAHLLERLGRAAEARVALDKAISLTHDPAERAHLTARRAHL
ncbi:RNA polymerase sigma factor [Pseudonocardia sichuanensis]